MFLNKIWFCHLVLLKFLLIAKKKKNGGQNFMGLEWNVNIKTQKENLKYEKNVFGLTFTFYYYCYYSTLDFFIYSHGSIHYSFANFQLLKTKQDRPNRQKAEEKKVWIHVHIIERRMETMKKNSRIHFLD